MKVVSIEINCMETARCGDHFHRAFRLTHLNHYPHRINATPINPGIQSHYRPAAPFEVLHSLTRKWESGPADSMRFEKVYSDNWISAFDYEEDWERFSHLKVYLEGIRTMGSDGYGNNGWIRRSPLHRTSWQSRRANFIAHTRLSSE